MAKEQYIVSIDEGTSSCRALLIDKEARIVDMCQQNFKQYFPKSGWVEHDALEIWNKQSEVFAQLLAKKDLTAHDIAGIGITNQRETTVVWDRRTGMPIYNAIVWQDRRTADICEQIKKDGFDDYIVSNTGLVIDAYFSGTKVKWILDNVEGARDKAMSGDLCFGTIDSWLIFKMTQGKVHATDYTNASRTMLFNIKSKEWDKQILEYFDIPLSMLPEVKDSVSSYGEYYFQDFPIPICSAIGDQQSALFGQACFESGDAKNTYGTGCFLLMNIGDKFIDSKNGLITTLCCAQNGKPVYALEGSVFVAGAAVQWMRDEVQAFEDSAQSEAMAESVKNNHDVVFVPAFTGLGAPYWNMYARGAIFGLTRGTTMNDMVKATLDALAYQSKDVLIAMIEDSGIELNALKVDGGAVRNNYLMQFQSNILQVDVERPVNVETTAMGAAYLAGMQLGWWDHNVIRQQKQLDKIFVPQMDVATSNKLYARWKKAVLRSLDWMEEDE